MSGKVQGHCPACGHASLFLGSGGYVTCSIRECPDPTLVADILDDREIHHVVELSDNGFTVRHPLRERRDDAMLACSLGSYLSNLTGPPLRLGRYIVRASGDSWRSASWTEVRS